MILYENTVNQFLNSCLNKKMFSYVIEELEKHYENNLVISYADYKACIYEIMIFVMNNNVNKDCGIRIDYINDEKNSRLAFIFASKNDKKTDIGLVEMYPIVAIKPTNDATAVLATNSLNQESTTVIEPYMQSLAYVKYLFKNNFDDNCDCYVIPFLYDCLKENGYGDDEEDEEFTYAYAGEYEKIEKRIKNVISDGNGIEALKYLHSKDHLPFNYSENLNDFYSLILYLISQDKKENINSLYLVKSYVDVIFDKNSQDYIKKENINIIINDFSYDKLNKNGSTIFFYDELSDKEKKEIIDYATKNNIVIRELDANTCLNYEEELNYLARFIDKTDDGSLENLYVMNNYDITVVDNENELVDKPGYAKISASDDVYYNKEEKIIINWNLLFKPLVKSFVNGDKGVYLYVADDGLRQHLKQEIQKMKTDEENFQKIADIAKNDGDINDILNSVGSQTKESATQIIINSLGNECWSKLCEDSKLSLISGYLVLESLKKCDKTADFSGSCLQICKAVEYELTSRYVTEYIKYIKDKYNEDALNKAPYALLKEQKNENDPKEFIDPDFATLGNFRFVMGLQSNGDVANIYAWNEFEDYAKNKLLKDTTNTQETLSEHISYVIKIKNDYRNKSAHKNFMDLAQGADCYNYIVGDLKKLSRILDSYKF